MNRVESFARGRFLGAACLLAVLAFALYAETGSFEFLNYDDPDYVSRNPAVARGLSLDGARWAAGFHAANWHPLTWLSHMLDVQLFGLEPGPMHVVNAVLHALNAGLLFLALSALTLRFWPSLLVAALFAVHPLRVQVVAWIAERKELLASAFFFALLGAYARYARTRGRAAYAAVVAFLALGCMAKPMLVTAPFVLLLLDAWPLARLGANPPAESAARVWLEKLPLFAIAAASCSLTVLAQRAGGALGELAALSFADRLWTAGTGVLEYLRSCAWPSGLAAFYPHPLLTGGGVLVTGAIGLAVVLALSLAAWVLRRRAPALFTGWFWFIGMLVPVLGLMQVGDPAWADRYAYLPSIGLAMALVFGLAEALRERENLLAGLALAGVAAAAALSVVTARTLPHWRDSRALFERALAVTEGNWIAHNNLGLVYLERRETARAREHFESAARMRPSFVQARFNLGLAREADGQFAQAVESYRAALAVRPGHAETLLRMAALARAEGSHEQAKEFYEQAIQANPSHAGVWIGFARLLLETGDVDRAGNCAASALKLEASLPDAHVILAEIALKRGDLSEAGERLARAEALAPPTAETRGLRGRLLFMKNDLAGARAEFEQAIVLDPNALRARYDLGTLLLNLRDVEAARSQFQAVNDIRPGDPEASIALAVIASNEGRSDEAQRLLEGALERSPGLPLALINLAAVHEQRGGWAEALDCYEKSFESGPPIPSAACAAAWILATGPDETLLDGARAVQLAKYALQRQADDAVEVLAAAHARAGDFEQAVLAQEEAVRRAQGEQKRGQEERLELYRAGKAYTRSR
jgi:tetratricopeptide (TPR) repeat protein